MHIDMKTTLLGGLLILTGGVLSAVAGPWATTYFGRKEADTVAQPTPSAPAAKEQVGPLQYRVASTKTDGNGSFAVAHGLADRERVLGVFAALRRSGEGDKWYQLRTIPGETAVLSWDDKNVYGYWGNPEFTNSEVRVTIIEKGGG